MTLGLDTIPNDTLMGSVETEPLTINEFLAQVQKPAYRMAKLSTLNTEDALDLVQDSMLKLVDKYQHKTAQEWRPLFYTILSSKLKDWHRKRIFRSQFIQLLGHRPDAADPLEQLADDLNASADRQMDARRQLTEVLTLISQLSERQRQALLLRVWQGFSAKQTAKIMGCSVGAVKTHLHRAQQTLNKQRGEHHG